MWSLFFEPACVGASMLLGAVIFYFTALMPVSDPGYGTDIIVRCPTDGHDQEVPTGHAHFTCQQCRRTYLTAWNLQPAEPFN